jgi:hypothetical protein
LVYTVDVIQQLVYTVDVIQQLVYTVDVIQQLVYTAMTNTSTYVRLKVFWVITYSADTSTLKMEATVSSATLLPTSNYMATHPKSPSWAVLWLRWSVVHVGFVVDKLALAQGQAFVKAIFIFLSE